MTRVDFYVLKQSGEDARQTFCCKLAEKAYALSNTVHIHVESEEQAKRLDTLLWTFRDESFIPHELVTDTETTAPITIGTGKNSAQKTLLINLGNDVPTFANQFERIAEIVSNDETIKTASRSRFTTYRDSGYAIETHKL